MKGKSTAILFTVIASIIVMGLLSYFGIGREGFFSYENIRQGLDLKGGVSIVYEANKEGAPTADEMSSAVSMIRGRLDRKGYTEAEVAKQNENRIRVEIPGVSNAEAAIKEIGQTAQIYFEDEDGNVLLTGKDVVNAQKVIENSQTGGAGSIVVLLEFSDEGKKLFEEATGNNVGKAISIKLDDQVLSAPTVSQKITGGNGIIQGQFTGEYAEELAALIRAGSLPFALNVIEMNNVGARLGADALSTSLMAGLIGAALVFLFMIFFYKVAGLAADIALMVYVGLILCLLSLFGITLTLPGIAGIILSVGMAVDANIIIFERMREEVAAGRSMRFALDSGFSRAFPAILDGNVTTLIAAAVLFWLGTGPIKGFAQTLSIGIIISMFTALVVTRFVLKSFVGLGLTSQKLYVGSKEGKLWNIIAKRKAYFTVSIAIIGIGIAAMAFFAFNGNGMFNYDVDFVGGTSIQIDIGKEFSNSDIISVINEVAGQQSPQVQKVLGSNKVTIKMKSVDQETRMALVAKLLEKYELTESALLNVSDVSATISSEMQSSALLALLVACLAMLVYVSLRFRDIAMGASAIFALVHDALVVLAAYALLRIQMNYAFIAAILTIVGYSINSTIVIFDRIRENRVSLKRVTQEELIDKSVSQTLRRSLYTSLTTLLTLIFLYVLGVPSIKVFTLPIIIGIVCGTYSSVFLAGSFWFSLSKKKES